MRLHFSRATKTELSIIKCHQKEKKINQFSEQKFDRHVVNTNSNKTHISSKPDAVIMTKNEQNKSFQIKITNFINPHNFYFKLENLMSVREQEIGEKLKNYANANRMKYITGYEPNINEDVVVHIKMEMKWLRGKVDAILKQYDGTEYVVWCVDHG